jgi:DNA-binding transcriptional MerR regulator
VTYSTADVCAMTGATYRQVDYWARRGLIAGQDSGPGYGRCRIWTREQVSTVVRLVEASKRRTRWAEPITS